MKEAHDATPREHVQSDDGILGTVRSLWRYPVKSMLGEQREYLDFDRRGVVGDRVYAVRVADGKLGSGKNTRRFRKVEGLLQFRAVGNTDAVQIFFPDNRMLRADDADLNAALTAVLGQPVTLTAESEVSHLDVAAVHLVTGASLARLQDALADSRVDERRFRPNLVLDVTDAMLDHEGPGQMIRIGNRVKLRIASRTERCGMVAMAQSELSIDPRILRHLLEHTDARFGLYADVVEPGRVHRGDVVADIRER